MDDRDFCVEYVKRIDLSVKSKTKTSIQMVEIVLHGKKIPVNEMFNDESLLKLHKDSVNLFVYKFVRDNQNCFFGCSGTIK